MCAPLTPCSSGAAENACLSHAGLCGQPASSWKEFELDSPGQTVQVRQGKGAFVERLKRELRDAREMLEVGGTSEGMCRGAEGVP